MMRKLEIYADAGFREAPQGLGTAGLGVFIPSLGSGVSLSALASDNNEAESLAILLGIAIGRFMNLREIHILTDSLLNFNALTGEDECEDTMLILQRALKKEGITLSWRPRVELTLADFFASLALQGKSLIATTPNAKNAAEKFRPLLTADRKIKKPIKDLTLKWLTFPAAPKSPFHIHDTELASTMPDLQILLGEKLPTAEFRALRDDFLKRAHKKSASVSNCTPSKALS